MPAEHISWKPHLSLNSSLVTIKISKMESESKTNSDAAMGSTFMLAVVDETVSNNNLVETVVEDNSQVKELPLDEMDIDSASPIFVDDDVEDGVLYMKIPSNMDLDANSNCTRKKSEAEYSEIEKFLSKLLSEKQGSPESTYSDKKPPIEDTNQRQISMTLQASAPSTHQSPTTICSTQSIKPTTYEQLLANGTSVLFHLDNLHGLVLFLKNYAVGTSPASPVLSQSVDECWTRSKCWILAMVEMWNRATDSTQISTSKDFEDIMNHLMGLQLEHSGISDTMRDTEFSLKEFLKHLGETCFLLEKVRKLTKVVLAEAVPIILPVQRKVFKPTATPIDLRSKPGLNNLSQSTQSWAELPSIWCGIDGFSIRMKWKGKYTDFKMSQMTPRQLIHGITMLNRGFHNFALTSFSIARRLEFSLRTSRNSVSHSAALDQALIELGSGMKRSAFLYAPEQRDLYRVVQQIETVMEETKRLADEVKIYTKSARKMWTSFCEKNNAKLGRKFYNSPDWNLVNEISFSLYIEPPSLFGTLELFPGPSVTTESFPTHATNRIVRQNNVESMIRTRSRRLIRGRNVSPETEDIELCGTAVQLVFLYSDYIVSETKVTLDEVMSLNETLFRVHWQNPPIESFCSISIWMLVSAECLFSVQKTCILEKNKKKVRMEFMRTFHQVEKLITMVERASQKYLSLSQDVQNMIIGITKRVQDSSTLNLLHEQSSATVTAELDEPVVLHSEREESARVDEPRLIITEGGLLIHVSGQTYTFPLLPPASQMKVFQMILQHLSNLLNIASITYSEALRLAGDSSIPKTPEMKDDDAISKLVEEMERLFKGFKTVNDLEVIVATKSLRILEESLTVLRKEIAFKNVLQRNSLSRQLVKIQKIYDKVLFRNDSRNSASCSIAHHIGGELEIAVKDRTFKRELERILEVPSELTSMPPPAGFRKFIPASKIGRKVDEALKLLDRGLEVFHGTTLLMLQPQPLLPIPEFLHTMPLALGHPVFLHDAYSIFLGLCLLELNSKPAKFMSDLLKKITSLDRKLETCMEMQKKIIKFYEESVGQELLQFQTTIDPLLDKERPDPSANLTPSGSIQASSGTNEDVRANCGEIVVRWDSDRSLILVGYVGYTKFTPFTVSSCSRQERVLLSLVKLMSITVNLVLKRNRNYKKECTRVQKALGNIRNFVAGSYINSDKLSHIRNLKSRLDGTKEALALLQQRLLALKGKLKISMEFVRWELARTNSKDKSSRALLTENPVMAIIKELPAPFQVVLWSTEAHK